MLHGMVYFVNEVVAIVHFAKSGSKPLQESSARGLINAVLGFSIMAYLVHCYSNVRSYVWRAFLRVRALRCQGTDVHSI